MLELNAFTSLEVYILLGLGLGLRQGLRLELGLG